MGSSGFSASKGEGRRRVCVWDCGCGFSFLDVAMECVGMAVGMVDVLDRIIGGSGIGGLWCGG